ncbi:hypothetical protein BMAJHU_E0333, partial [Burkholderia mallei JHU]
RIPFAPFCFRQRSYAFYSVSRRPRDFATQWVMRRFGDKTDAFGRMSRDPAVDSNLANRSECFTPPHPFGTPFAILPR